LKVSENIDVDLLENVSDELKPILKQLLNYIDIEQEKTNSFTEKQIYRMITELNSGVLNITIGNSDKLSTEYDETLKENPYLKAYYRSNSTQKKIAIRSAEEQKMLGSLSHELEHFLVDDRLIEEMDTYIETEYELFVNLRNDEDNLIYNTEFNGLEKQNPKGGFRGDCTNEDWLEMWNEAATEIIACDRVNLPITGYTIRVDFLNAVLKVNGQTIDDLRQAYRLGDLSYIYNLMPKSKLLNISKLEAQLYNSTENTELMGMNNNVYARSIMDNELLDYLLEVKETDEHKLMSEEEQKKIFIAAYILKCAGGTDEDKDMGAYNKVELKTKKLLSREKSNSISSQELITKLGEWYREQGILGTLEDLPRMQLIYLRGIAFAKKSFGDDTEQIDEICTEFENRLVHREKLKLNANKILEKSVGKVIKTENIRFDEVEKHFVYINGERYLNRLIEANVMKVKIYDVDLNNMSIITIVENGAKSESIQQEYEDKKEFLFKLNQISDRTKSNAESVHKFNIINKQEMQKLFDEGIKITKDKQKSSDDFISFLKNSIASEVSLTENIKEESNNTVKKEKAGEKHGR